MQARWCVVVMIACSASPAARSKSAEKTASAATTTEASVEGYVRDARTGATVPGIRVEAWLGPLDNGHLGAWEISDERGFFQLDVEPGTGFLLVETGEVEDAPSVTFRAGVPVRMDLKVDPDELAKSRELDPPEACPSSPPGTVVEGHTTSQHDLDDIARTILQRSATEPTAIPDLGIRARDGEPIAVRVEVRPRKKLSAAALPPTGFVLKPFAQLQAEADQREKDVSYVELWGVYSNGSCAVVHIGGDFVSPSKKQFGKLCCCTAHDVYEKREGKWVFVRRVSQICS